MNTILGLLELVVYVLAILALSAALTWTVIRISPAQSAKRKPDEG